MVRHLPACKGTNCGCTPTDSTTRRNVALNMQARQLDVSGVDYFDADSVARTIGVSRAMAAEIEYMNDEWGNRDETPAQRWERMRKWASDNIAAQTPNIL